MKQITFVVGAGASSEYGLPVGNALKKDIVSALRQRAPGGNVSDQDLYYAISHFAQRDKDSPGNIQPYINATDHISHSLVLSPSIDNFINSHNGDHRVEIIVKLGIAKCILDSERNSSLCPDRNRDRDPFAPRVIPRLDFNSFSDTWMVSLFMLLNQDCSFSALKSKLEKIALVVFNYDRCVEQFLHEAIKSFYRVSDSEATEALSHLDIYHPYGLIGALPWQESAHIQFGAEADSATLIAAVGNIKTFSESNTVTDSETNNIRDLIASSHSLVFLGFGFIPLNMKLLQPHSHHPNSKRNTVFATTFCVSSYDKQRVSTELMALSGSKLEPHMTDSKASALFSEYTRGLRI
jgi:hypothetical protein